MAKKDEAHTASLAYSQTPILSNTFARITPVPKNNRIPSINIQTSLIVLYHRGGILVFDYRLV